MESLLSNPYGITLAQKYGGSKYYLKDRVPHHIEEPLVQERVDIGLAKIDSEGDVAVSISLRVCL